MIFDVSKDALWKGIIEDLFEEFMYYFFPAWALNEADFSRPFEFLDKELAEILLDSDNGIRHADKLVKVYTKAGLELWCLIHVEIQGYKDVHFPERMYIYFSRIKEKYQHDILAFALYTDEHKDYHPQKYVYEYWGTKLEYSFNTFKLLSKTPAELDIPNNPFSIVMLTAYNALQKSMKSDSNQIVWKFMLVRKFLEGGYKTDKIRRILNFIRYYIRFTTPTAEQTYTIELSTIIPEPKNMGVEEVILEALKEHVTREVTQEVTREVTREVTQKINQKAVKNMLEKGISDELIMNIQSVDKAFIEEVRKMMR
jgi:hypothetical protein